MKVLLSLDPEEDQALSVCLSGAWLGTLSYQECALLNFSSAEPEYKVYTRLHHTKQNLNDSILSTVESFP